MKLLRLIWLSILDLPEMGSGGLVITDGNRPQAIDLATGRAEAYWDLRVELEPEIYTPAPDRKRTGSWRTFLKAHWDVLAAVDFTTVEVWTKGGLVTFYLLFVMELRTRKVHSAGITTSPHERG